MVLIYIPHVDLFLWVKFMGFNLYPRKCDVMIQPDGGETSNRCQVMEEQGQSVQWSMKKCFVNGVYECIRYTLWLLNIAMEAMALRNR